LGLQESIAVACWYIWWQRREIVKDVSVTTPTRTAFPINALAANYGAASEKAVRRDTVWNKPLMGYYKMNTDASYFSTGSGAAGAVLRNSSGEAIASCYCPLDNILSAATAEAIALLRGLEPLEQL
jgi:hypothetical protein